MRSLEAGTLVLASGQRIPRPTKVVMGGRAVPPGTVSPGDTVQIDGATLVLRPSLLRGEFMDTRYGELLLGRVNLMLPDGADVRLNGRPAKAADLPPGQAAVVRYEPATGRVGRLEVVDPRQKREKPAAAGDIWSVTASAPRPLRAGETVRLELKAPSGGRAAFDVAGLTWDLPAREAAPGIYRAEFQVVPGMDVRDTFVLGRFSRQGVAYPVRVGNRLSLAASPPEVRQWGPTGAATSAAPVFAVYESAGATVDAARVSLRLDGVDVTRRCRRTVSVVLCEEGLTPGRHRAEVRVVDTAGNATVKAWDFQVR